MQIFQTRFGTYKKYEFYCGDKISIKVKGNLFFKRHVIVNMKDSLLLDENDSIIKIGQIKAVRFKKAQNAMGRLGFIFLKGAAITLYVDAIANYMYGSGLSLDPRALYIAGACGAGYFIFQLINTKQIRINHRVVIKIFDPGYHKLNKP